MPGLPRTPLRLILVIIDENRREAIFGAIYSSSVKIGRHSEQLGDKIPAANGFGHVQLRCAAVEIVCFKTPTYLGVGLHIRSRLFLSKTPIFTLTVFVDAGPSCQIFGNASTGSKELVGDI